MKTYLASILKVIILFFAPIKPLIILISLSTIIDTAFGVWKAKQLNEKITSKIFRNGLVPKLISYITTIMMVYGSDAKRIDASWAVGQAVALWACNPAAAGQVADLEKLKDMAKLILAMRDELLNDAK